MQVIKHDGRVEEYTSSKVGSAVEKAMKAVGHENPDVVDRIVFNVTVDLPNEQCTVDEIHDAVEKELMKADKDAAKAYILYRQKRTEYRDKNSELNKQIERYYSTINKDNANAANGSAASKMYSIAEAATKQYNLSHMNPVFAKNHKIGRNYIHDNGYRQITFNCFFNPLSDMLKNGFNNGVGFVRTPKRIGSAVALACIILQSSQNDMFGGQGYLNFDTDLAPYAEEEYEYQKKKYLETLSVSELETYSLDDVDKAEIMANTENAIYQAMEQFVYNCNMMRSRSGAQVTFSSVNFGTDTSFWARMISKNLFRAYIAGLGNGENPIFPNLCYRVKKGVNLKEGDPNFDITKLAIECVGKRIQPRFVFCDSPAYDGMPLEHIGTMGCLEKNEVVCYRYHGDYYCEGIGRLWRRIEENAQDTPKSQFVIPSDLQILDGTKFVPVKTVVKNKQVSDWYRVKFSDGRSIVATHDHPFYTENKGRIKLLELEKGDTIKVYWDAPSSKTEPIVLSTDVAKAYYLGVMIADGNYSQDVSATFGVDEQDIIKGFRNATQMATGHSTVITSYLRGEKGNYEMVRVYKPKELREKLLELFGGKKKEERSIPQYIFRASTAERLAFLAGMVDADGHVLYKSKVQIGSTNKELALQQLALAQSLGYPAKMYLNHYKSGTDKIRYRVEFTMSNMLSLYMLSKKKIDTQWNGKESCTETPDVVKVVSVEKLDMTADSYDVETTTDHFNASFIRSGNCRTAVRDNVNGDKNPDARGNLAFNTINLPFIALESKTLAKEQGREPLDVFKEQLDKIIDETIAELLDRYDVISHLKKRDIPFVGDWYQGHEGLEDDDIIEPMVKNGSLSIGFIGLAECLIALIDKHHGESEEAQKLGLKIVGRIRERADEAKEEYHLNFSCFATPKHSVGA